MLNNYDRDGEPITFEEADELSRDKEYKRVAWDKLPDGTEVSTVWLGLDHGWGRGPKLIFETMTFPQYGQWRYSTLEEARRGHTEVVSRLSSNWVTE